MSSKSKSEKQKNLEKDFESKLDNLFDMAHNDALKLIDNEEDRQFLILQREGRIGSLGGVDKKLAEKQSRKRKQTTKLESRKKKQKELIEELSGKQNDNYHK